MLFGLLQGGLYLFARGVANGAAEEGVNAARSEHGSAGDGIAAADAFLAKVLGGGLIENKHVSASRSGETATVTVTGTVYSPLPGMDLTIHRTVSGPVERITQPDGQD